MAQNKVITKRNSPENTIIGKYIADDKIQQLIYYLESTKDFDRYYIALSLKMNYRDFNIKYFNNSFSKEERVSIYKFVNKYFYNDKLKIDSLKINK